MEGDWLRGEEHPKARLSDAKVRRLRATYASKKALDPAYGYGACAVEFGCGVSTVRDLILKRTRK